MEGEARLSSCALEDGTDQNGPRGHPPPLPPKTTAPTRTKVLK